MVIFVASRDKLTICIAGVENLLGVELGRLAKITAETAAESGRILKTHLLGNQTNRVVGVSQQRSGTLHSQLGKVLKRRHSQIGFEQVLVLSGAQARNVGQLIDGQ